MNSERRQWLKEQLANKSECQLFNFGMQNDKNCGWDIHGDVVDLLAENEALRETLETIKDYATGGCIGIDLEGEGFKGEGTLIWMIEEAALQALEDEQSQNP